MPDSRGELPQEVLEIVVSKLRRRFSLQAYLTLQLVSKSWKAAVRNAFRGDLEVQIDDASSASISRMCRVLPGMSSLSIETPGLNFDLSPVSALSSLVVLGLKNISDSVIPEADLKSLPTSLQTLVLSGFHLRNLQHLRCVRLRELRMVHENFDEVYPLLEALPSLKVSS